MSVIGRPTKMIPLCEPVLAGNEGAYLADCVQSGWVSYAGGYVERFEQLLAEFTGAAAAAVVTSGTAAIHLGLLLLGIQRDDEVLMPSLTFIAPANAVRYVGAWPFFLDVDRNTAQLDVAQVERHLASCVRTSDGRLRNPMTGRHVAAIMPVHVLGHMVSIDELLSVAAKYDLPVIEDATEGLGASLAGRACGTWGRVGCLSFNGNKMITSGGGGALISDDVELIRRARFLSTQAKDDPVEYIHPEIGYNYRLTNIQAAVGLAQLECIGAFLDRKAAIAHSYQNHLAEYDYGHLIQPDSRSRSAHWLSTAFLPKLDRRSLLAYLRDSGVQTRPLWEPMHQSRAHSAAGHLPCPVTEALHHSSLSLPSSSNLQEQDIAYVVSLIDAFASNLNSRAGTPQ